ncbi:DUF3103 domain-containing protein [Flavobacterium sediminilitoris]|uniref:DUF3103 domain-containing protein n=1 Tax=Flavobacterium sediminilitoris TaxID=2024526 RepID=A0ABY4HTD3_9FLAO|nr:MULTISPECIES: DUF3103 family protein [Flavobacterium]UOX34809.1 DUF3103 domain-containing protein [Flavobacterium sediminilitoris]
MKTNFRKIASLVVISTFLFSCSNDPVIENNELSYLTSDKIEFGKYIANSIKSSNGISLFKDNKFKDQNEVLLTEVFNSLNIKNSEEFISPEIKKEGILECFVYNQEKMNSNFLNDLQILFVPIDDNVEKLEGVDINGNKITVNALTPSDKPMLFIDQHGKFEFQKNMKLFNEELKKRGLDYKLTNNISSQSTAVDFNKIDSIKLSDVEEPWFKGNPEIYAIVFNFDKNFNDPSVPPLRVLQMPYIKKKDVLYTPEQPFVFWNEHTRNAATMIIMEEDSGFDYAAVINIVVQAIGTGVTLGTGDVVWTPFVVNTVTSVLDAIKGSWSQDSDDEIDQYYIIRKENVTQLKKGASNNASITYSFETL